MDALPIKTGCLRFTPFWGVFFLFLLGLHFKYQRVAFHTLTKKIMEAPVTLEMVWMKKLKRKRVEMGGKQNRRKWMNALVFPCWRRRDRTILDKRAVDMCRWEGYCFHAASVLYSSDHLQVQIQQAHICIIYIYIYTYIYTYIYI